MMLMGTRSTRKLLGTGEFRCPACSKRRKYEKRRAKRWGHVFGVPLIPMEESAPYIECRTCKGTFVEGVLDPHMKAAQIRAEFERAAGLVMAKMILADGRVEDTEKAMLRTILERITEGSVEPEFIDALIAKARSDDRTAEEIAARFAGSLNFSGAEQVMKASAMIAMADGDLAVEEARLLTGIAAALGMSESHYRTIMSAVQANPSDSARTIAG
jgi:uncharacterized tellurite resistance protein B-like protein